MKSLITTILIIGTMTCFGTARAEHSVGFAAGSTRGLGATYRYLPDSGDTSSWGWQVAGLPFITKDAGTVSFGAGLLYRLHQGRRAMAYASLGFGALTMWENCTDDTDIFCEDESHWGIGVGPGIGFELRMLDNVAWSVEIPLAVMFADGEFFGLYPVPNSSLVYYW
jgi:hypothetical protein